MEDLGVRGWTGLAQATARLASALICPMGVMIIFPSDRTLPEYSIVKYTGSIFQIAAYARAITACNVFHAFPQQVFYTF